MTSRSRRERIRRRPNWNSMGQRRVELQDGALVIKTANDSIRLEAPRVYQEIDGRKQPVQSNFVVRGANRAGFAIGVL